MKTDHVAYGAAIIIAAAFLAWGLSLVAHADHPEDPLGWGHAPDGKPWHYIAIKYHEGTTAAERFDARERMSPSWYERELTAAERNEVNNMRYAIISDGERPTLAWCAPHVAYWTNETKSLRLSVHDNSELGILNLTVTNRGNASDSHVVDLVPVVATKYDTIGRSHSTGTLDASAVLKDAVMTFQRNTVYDLFLYAQDNSWLRNTSEQLLTLNVTATAQSIPLYIHYSSGHGDSQYNCPPSAAR